MGRLVASELEAQIEDNLAEAGLASGDVNYFSGLISFRDRERLRRIVRAEHLRHYPRERLTDLECDKFIDSWSENYVGEQIARGDVYG